MSFVRRQALTAGLTANAVRPVPGYAAGVPAALAGWLTGELAPYLLAATLADVVRETRTRRPGSPTGVGLAVGSALGLTALTGQALRAGSRVESALAEGLGADYRHRLRADHPELDAPTPLHRSLLPLPLPRRAVEVVRDVAYADHGRRGLFDLYRPRDSDGSPAPVLLQVHGGAWRIGAKGRQALPLLHQMAARGWVCVAINYRLSPGYPFPAQVVDVKRALAWLRAHGAEHGADPRFVAVTGGSAGGHLAALAALTPGDPALQPGFEDADTTVQAAVPHYGVYDLAGASGTRRSVQLRDRFLGPKVLLRDPSTDPGAFERASPLLRVSAQAPPFLVVHGGADSLVGVDQARRFVRALRDVSPQPVVYAELPGAQHGFDLLPSPRSAAVVGGVDRFLTHVHDAWRAG